MLRFPHNIHPNLMRCYSHSPQSKNPILNNNNNVLFSTLRFFFFFSFSFFCVWCGRRCVCVRAFYFFKTAFHIFECARIFDGNLCTYIICSSRIAPGLSRRAISQQEIPPAGSGRKILLWISSKSALQWRFSYTNNFVFLILNLDAITGFEKLMQIQESTTIVSYTRGSLISKITFPVAMCNQSKSGGHEKQQQIGIGAILAVADVLTTIALIVKDPDLMASYRCQCNDDGGNVSEYLRWRHDWDGLHSSEARSESRLHWDEGTWRWGSHYRQSHAHQVSEHGFPVSL